MASASAGFGFVSRSLREARTLEALGREGVGCPEWLAAGEDELGRAFLLVREAPGATELRLAKSSDRPDGAAAAGPGAGPGPGPFARGGVQPPRPLFQARPRRGGRRHGAIPRLAAFAAARRPVPTPPRPRPGGAARHPDGRSRLLARTTVGLIGVFWRSERRRRRGTAARILAQGAFLHEAVVAAAPRPREATTAADVGRAAVVDATRRCLVRDAGARRRLAGSVAGLAGPRPPTRGAESNRDAPLANHGRRRRPCSSGEGAD